LFPYLPGQPGYHKRLRNPGAAMRSLIRAGPRDQPGTDDAWVVYCTPVECGRSKDPIRRSDLAGWGRVPMLRLVLALVLGLRLHPVCTLHVQIIIGDKNYYGRRFEAALPGAGLHLMRPARHGEPERAATQFFKPLHQIIESINDTLKGQLDLGRYGGHTPAGVAVRILQRMR
jgi:hypothetical protein